MKTYSDVPSRPCQGRRRFLAPAAVALLAAIMAAALLGRPGTAQGREEREVTAAPAPTVATRSVDDLHQRWQEVLAGKSRTILLDVREPWEFDAGHIEGSSHVALGNLSSVPQLVPDRQAEIWVFCRTQRRAALAVEQLKAMGYANLSLVAGQVLGGAGGIMGWTDKGYPLWTPQSAASGAREGNCRHFVRQGLTPGQGCQG